MLTEVWQLLRLPALVIKALWQDAFSASHPATAGAAGRLRFIAGGICVLLLAAAAIAYVHHAGTAGRSATAPQPSADVQASAGTSVRQHSDAGCARTNVSTYTLCSDEQIAEWDIAEAREIQQLTHQPADGAEDQSDAHRSLFDKAFFECCFAQLKSLRQESLRRLGKTGLSLEELEVWDRLADDPKTAPYLYKMNDAQDYAEVLGQLGLLLLHRARAS